MCRKKIKCYIHSNNKKSNLNKDKTQRITKRRRFHLKKVTVSHLWQKIKTMR